MKTVARMALKPGMVLGEDVLSYKNDLLFKKDTKISDQDIAKLARYSIMAVSVMEPIDYATTHFEKVRVSDDFRAFEIIYEANLNLYKDIINNTVIRKYPIKTNVLLQIYKDISGSLKNNKVKMLDYLYNMLPSKDDVTYAHCLNSALIAGVIAEWLNLNDEETNTLILCAFLYDIGKILLPNELIWKPTKLTDQEFRQVKNHTIDGFMHISNQNIDENIFKATLQHHERCDGTGYPSRLKENQINRYAKIISIIDAYEAMTSARLYRESMTPFKVIDNLISTRSYYSDSILSPFLDNLAKAQLGTTVRLNDGRIGEVVLINHNDLAKPLVKIDGKLVNLSTTPNIEIVAAI